MIVFTPAVVFYFYIRQCGVKDVFGFMVFQHEIYPSKASPPPTISQTNLKMETEAGNCMSVNRLCGQNASLSIKSGFTVGGCPAVTVKGHGDK